MYRAEEQFDESLEQGRKIAKEDTHGMELVEIEQVRSLLEGTLGENTSVETLNITLLDQCAEHFDFQEAYIHWLTVHKNTYLINECFTKYFHRALAFGERREYLQMLYDYVSDLNMQGIQDPLKIGIQNTTPPASKFEIGVGFVLGVPIVHMMTDVVVRLDQLPPQVRYGIMAFVYTLYLTYIFQNQRRIGQVFTEDLEEIRQSEEITMNSSHKGMDMWNELQPYPEHLAHFIEFACLQIYFPRMVGWLEMCIAEGIESALETKVKINQSQESIQAHHLQLKKLLTNKHDIHEQMEAVLNSTESGVLESMFVAEEVQMLKVEKSQKEDAMRKLVRLMRAELKDMFLNVKTFGSTELRAREV